MKPKHLFIQLLAALFTFPFMGTFVHAQTVEFDVLTVFDYPGTGNLTRPQKINDGADIVGEYVDSSGATRGFIRYHKGGNFSPPIIEPNDTGNFTEGRGVNNSHILCGDYTGSDGLFHGFFLSGNTFTEYDVAGASGTEVLGINNAGDFAGGFVDASSGISTPFVNIGGAVMPVNIPGSTAGFAYQLNATNWVVGYFTDSAGITHGFYQDETGTLHAPIDPPDSTGTILFGINDRNWIVGRYADSAGATHALFFLPPNQFTTFDFPGSTFTSFNGVNRKALICGRYIDAAGIEHGIVARAVRTAEDGASQRMRTINPELPVTITKSLSPIKPVTVPAS